MTIKNLDFDQKTMGRHRTHRAAQKLITNHLKKVDTKRNRDKRLRRQRRLYSNQKQAQMRKHQEYMKQFETIQVKPSDLERMVKKGVNEKFFKRVQEAQTSYDSMLALIDESQAIICVLDARDPTACRFINIEGEAKGRNKPLIFVITKVDLVPKDPVEMWIHALSKVAPTFAFNALTTTKESKLVQSILEITNSAEKVAVVGPHGVGKSQLISVLGGDKFGECEPWKFTICGVDLGLIGAVEWKGRMREFAINFLDRQLTDDIFKALDVMKLKKDPIVTEDGETIERKVDSGTMLAEYGLKQGVGKSEAGDVLTKALLNGDFKWVSVPNIGEEKVELTPEQNEALAGCPSAEGYLLVSPDTSVKTDDKALQWVPPPESSDSEYEYDGEEEEEEEGNEEEDEEEDQ